jgi:hypothetical protein
MPDKAFPRHATGSAKAVPGLRQNPAQFMLLMAVNARHHHLGTRHRHGLPNTSLRHRRHRAPGLAGRSAGVYRLWRDGGFAVDALLSGFVADLYGIPAAISAVAILTAASDALVAARMRADDHL